MEKFIIGKYKELTNHEIIMAMLSAKSSDAYEITMIDKTRSEE